MYVCVHVRVRVRVRVRLCTGTCACACVRTCARVCARVCVRAGVQKHPVHMRRNPTSSPLLQTPPPSFKPLTSHPPAVANDRRRSSHSTTKRIPPPPPLTLAPKCDPPPPSFIHLPSPSLPPPPQDLLDELSRQFELALSEALPGTRQPDQEPEAYFDRNCQWCFLRARNWDVAAALAQMKACLQWRVEARPWEVKCDACGVDPITHTMRQVG